MPKQVEKLPSKNASIQTTNGKRKLAKNPNFPLSYACTSPSNFARYCSRFRLLVVMVMVVNTVIIVVIVVEDHEKPFVYRPADCGAEDLTRDAEGGAVEESRYAALLRLGGRRKTDQLKELKG